MFTSVAELKKMVRSFMLRHRAASTKWSPPVFGITKLTKNEVKRAFAEDLKMYNQFAIGNDEVQKLIQGIATGLLEDDSDDGTSTLKELAGEEA